MSAAPAPVVLCHSRADRFAAETIGAALIDAQIAFVSVPDHADDSSALAAMLSQARVLVVVHSQATGDNGAVLRAVQAATTKQLPVVAVRLDAAQPAAAVAELLRNLRWFDASNGTLPARLPRLVTRIRQVAGFPLGDADLVDDGEGGIDLWTVERRRVHRGWLVAGTVLLVVLALLGWRAFERRAADRAFEHGIAWLAAGDSRAAAQAFDAALARRPDWAAAWRQLAFATSDPTAQVVAFTRAIELDPADADAYAGRARARAQSAQLAAAAADFDAALARSPGTAAWHGERGLVRLLLVDETGAAADFARCGKLEPRCADTFGPRIAAAEAGRDRPARDWFALP